MAKGRVFTIEDIKNSAVGNLNTHLFTDPPKKEKKHKYSSQKGEVDWEVFDSKKEARRYTVLKKLLKAGEIAFLARQVEYELNTDGSFSLVYVADFQYVDKHTGLVIVEDCKGYLTKEYKKKKKLMKKVHNIDIKEV